MDFVRRYKLVKTKHSWIKVATATTFIAGGVILGGNSALADTANVPTQAGNETQVANSADTKAVTQSNVDAAQTEVNDKQAKVKQATDDLSHADTVANDAQKAVDSKASDLKNAENLANNATPENIKNAQADAKAKADATETAKSDVDKAKAAKANADSDVNNLENKVNDANQDVAKAQNSVNDINAKINANDNSKVSPEEIDKANQDVNNANADVTAKQALLDQANNNLKNNVVVGNANYIKLPSDIYKSIQEDVDAVCSGKYTYDEYEKALKKDDENFIKNITMSDYQSSPADQAEQVNLNNLTPEQNMQIQNYFGSVINSMLDQLGKKPIKVGATGIVNAAKELADGYSADNFNVLNMDESDKSDWKKYDSSLDEFYDYNALVKAYDDNGFGQGPRFETLGFDSKQGTYDGHKTMDEVYQNIWNDLKTIISNDSDKGSNVFNLLFNGQTSANTVYEGFAYDKFGQGHFVGAEIFPSNDKFDKTGEVTPAPLKVVEGNSVELQKAVDEAQAAVNAAEANAEQAKQTLANLKNNPAQANQQNESTELKNQLTAATNQLNDANLKQQSLENELKQKQLIANETQAALNTAQNTFEQAQQAQAAAENYVVSLENAQANLTAAQQALESAQVALNKALTAKDESYAKVQLAQAEFETANTNLKQIKAKFMANQAEAAQNSKPAVQVAQASEKNTSIIANSAQAGEKETSTIEQLNPTSQKDTKISELPGQVTKQKEDSAKTFANVAESPVSNPVTVANGTSLPKTGQNNSSLLSIIGLSLLSLLSIFGLSYKKFNK